jgi:dihydrofolate reductase
MRSLSAFLHVSLDGYFADSRGDMSFAHHGADDPEWQAFTMQNASGGGELVFGRVTYELMASFWPTPQAAQQMPAVAERMNSLPKVVFSRTLGVANWQNTRLLDGCEAEGGIAGQMRRLKSDNGPGLMILGSGSLITQLAIARLLDGLQLVVNPLALGSGHQLFAGLPVPVDFVLQDSRAFANGKVLLNYRLEP